MSRLARAMPLSNGARRVVEALPVTQRALLVHPGDRSTHCCIVLSGWVGCFKLLLAGERQVLAFHVAGDAPDLQSPHLPTADYGICALTRAAVALVPHAAVHDLMAHHPDVTAALWREALVSASITREWMVGLGCRTGPGRLAHLFCEIYVRQKAAGLIEVEGRCALPLTQTVLADALGQTPVHINRMLRNMRAEGLVQHGRGTLTILNWDRLSALAAFDPGYLHLEPQGA